MDKAFFHAPILGLFFILYPLFTVKAQFAKFSEWEHDFGEVYQSAKPVTHRFTFENRERKDLLLTSAENSCGCTLSEWSKGPVSYKEKGFVEVSFDPTGRNGAFSETVTVRTNGQPELILLKIKGEVRYSADKMKQKYPVQIGSLRFRSSMLDFGNVWHDGKINQSLTAYNTSRNAVKISLDQSDFPDAITFKNPTVTVPSGDSLTIGLTFHADSTNDWGTITDFITFNTDDMESPEKRLHFMAHIKERFPEQESDSLPSIKVDRLKHDFGWIASQMEQTTFELSNVGSDTLLLRKISTSCGCTISAPDQDILPPGASTRLNVFFQPENEAGLIEKRITVISNDPDLPELRLYLYALKED